MIERYPDKYLLQDYSCEQLMNMVQKYRTTEVNTIGIHTRDAIIKETKILENNPYMQQ